MPGKKPRNLNMNSEQDAFSDIDDSDAVDVTRVTLKSLGLRAGMALQTRRLVAGASKKEGQYFSSIEGKGVMVGPVGPEGEKTELTAGEVCVIRGFTGQYEFSFLSKVLQTFEKPFAYALLAYPAEVDARQVRQSMRTKTSWPTTAKADTTVETTSIDVTLVDISMSGAMIKSQTAIASIGSTIILGISVIFDDAPIELTIAGRVCHSNQSTNDGSFYIGTAFKNLTQHDKLVLHFMTKNPQA